MSNNLVRAALASVLFSAAGLSQAALLPSANLGTITAPGSASFGDTNFTAGLNGTGSGTYTAPVNPQNYNFQDTFTFLLNPGANVAALAADLYFTDASGNSVLFGVSNLEVNISGPSGLFQAWTTVSSPSTGLFQEIALLASTPLTTGTYTMNVRGLVTGSGSYSGSVIAAVPLPGVLLLFLSGLTGLVPFGMRKRSFASA
jgi:hypothetical protein